MTPDAPDAPSPPPSLSVPADMSAEWLARKARAEAQQEAEAAEIATKKREHEERITREKRMVELLEKILEKLSEK
jgi:hypothetical protein